MTRQIVVRLLTLYRVVRIWCAQLGRDLAQHIRDSFKEQLELKVHPLHWYLVPTTTVRLGYGRSGSWLCVTFEARWPPPVPPRDTTVHPAPRTQIHYPTRTDPSLH